MALVLVGVVAGALLGACGGGQAKPNPTPPAASSAPAMSDADLAAMAADAGGADELIGGSGNGSTTTISNDAGAPIASTVTASTSGEDACAAPSAKFEETVRAKFNDCYQEGKKKDPELAGTVRITVSIDWKGKISSTKLTEGKDSLGDKVTACMLTAVKKTPFEGVESCKNKAVIVGKKFGK
ncbi:MAG TPA: hypothetical protein VF407_00405 [Polyangiaceae bacterium]